MTTSVTRLPIFPLPDLVFLPETTLPLHVFEPRYRDLLSDALAGEKVIGVQRLKAGPSTDAAGRPELYEIGCAGEIVEHEALEDGRSNIVLKGLFRYRIAREVEAGTSYRVAEVTPLAVEPLARAGDDAPSRDDLRRVLTHVVKQLAE
ncbi:MAG TPA: LON peptidase substrate-binding domain-containing protein, partial [Thermoanaerobaculia bacterium]|nr:LON peptidase substrate-binding domain-containing protein [Thermoanaerobaculia bacterium]